MSRDGSSVGSNHDYSTKWNKSSIYCPECSGDCLTDGHTLSCIECPFETTTDEPEGKRLLREYYG